jgi:crotonobetainyl-CoA:carnitine CoA-transferase CaiB-like acyl-CoA transferase
VKVSATPGRIPGPAPKLGVNTREALMEILDLDDKSLDRLAESGVIPNHEA